MMAIRRPHIALGFGLCALCAALPAWAQTSPPSASRRPVPHTDILTLPPEPATVSSVEAGDELVASSAPIEQAAPASERSEVPPGSPESKLIERRESSTGYASLDSEAQALKRREAGRSSGLLSDLWPLLAVLALIAAAAYLLKKFMPARGLLAGSNALQVVAQTHVTAKQQLMLVKVGRRLALIGVSPDRLSTLMTIDDPEQVAALLGEVASAQPGSMTRAFDESMHDEVAAYAQVDEDPTTATRGQVHGLLAKVRTLAGRTG